MGVTYNHKSTFLHIILGLAMDFLEPEAAECCNGHSVLETILPVFGGSLFNITIYGLKTLFQEVWTPYS